MFITQHSSVTVDAKLSPTVSALLCGDQDFLRSLSYWIDTGVKFHFELQNIVLVIVLQRQELLEIFLFSFSFSFNSCSIILLLSVWSRGRPDIHVSNSVAQTNARLLFICLLQGSSFPFSTEKINSISWWKHLSDFICPILFYWITHTFSEWRRYLY